MYLIQATTTGQRYVGLATGTGGVRSRWLSYADTGRGGNLGLKALHEAPNYPQRFQCLLLRVLEGDGSRRGLGAGVDG